MLFYMDSIFYYFLLVVLVITIIGFPVIEENQHRAPDGNGTKAVERYIAMLVKDWGIHCYKPKLPEPLLLGRKLSR